MRAQELWRAASLLKKNACVKSDEFHPTIHSKFPLYIEAFPLNSGDTTVIKEGDQLWRTQFQMRK
jgi:hypothetical protein